MQSVSDCAEFFLDGKPPQIPGVLVNGQIPNRSRYKPICQTYDGKRRFFSLYDTTNKIPVFSAYVFRGNEPGTKRPNIHPWMTEPQLEINMKGPSDPLDSQANDSDYTNNKQDCDRGHLRPSSFGYSQADMNSTFTLTNAVPQKHTFNTGSWKIMEDCVKCFMNKHCTDNNNRVKGFLVTGAEPGKNRLKGKINIPSMMWSAFCCYNSNNNKWLAGAYLGDNVHESKGKKLEMMTLNQLYEKFRKQTPFKLFSGNQCPSNAETKRYRRAAFYSELNNDDEDCNCEPTPTTTAPPSTTPAPTTTQKPTSASRATSTPSTTTTTASKKTTSPKITKKKPKKDGKPGNTHSGNGIGNALGGILGAIGGILGGLFGTLGSALSGVNGSTGIGVSGGLPGTGIVAESGGETTVTTSTSGHS